MRDSEGQAIPCKMGSYTIHVVVLVGFMSFWKMRGLYTIHGLTHHMEEISGDVMDAGHTDE